MLNDYMYTNFMFCFLHFKNNYREKVEKR